jgi:hypothetical protein
MPKTERRRRRGKQKQEELLAASYTPSYLNALSFSFLSLSSLGANPTKVRNRHERGGGGRKEAESEALTYAVSRNLVHLVPPARASAATSAAPTHRVRHTYMHARNVVVPADRSRSRHLLVVQGVGAGGHFPLAVVRPERAAVGG